MHPQKLIDQVVEFEKDLAAFYQKLENVEKFKPLGKILKFMHKHSDIHAELIRNFRSEASLPGLNIEPLHALHAKIKSALTDQLMTAKDLREVYEKLAQAETLISQIYTTIANHYEKMADVYSGLHHKFMNLSKDEIQHHNHIQTELEQFLTRDAGGENH